MKVRITDAAEDDIARAYRFYECRTVGLGNRFATAIYSAIDRLATTAGIHSKEFGYHCLICDRFPFGVLYEWESNEVLVVGVVDLRRDPDWIRRRLT